MHMKLLILTTTFYLFIFFKSYAQQGQSVSSADITSSAGNITYVVGQVFYNNYNTSSGNISEGVLQPLTLVNTAINQTLSSLLQVKAYPNPTTSDVIIDLVYQPDLIYEVCNSQGVILVNSSIAGNQTTLNFNSFASGVYFLTIRNSHEFVQSIKIIKN